MRSLTKIFRAAAVLALLLFLTGCPVKSPLTSQEPTSHQPVPLRNPKTGTCECPYDQTNADFECGERSSYSRGGGNRPVCYLGEKISQSPVTTKPQTSPATSSNPHLLMGNPSGAIASNLNKRRQKLDIKRKPDKWNQWTTYRLVTGQLEVSTKSCVDLMSSKWLVVVKLMSLSPHKLPNYQQGLRAMRLIQSVL